jgi:hypothetical protein
MGDDITPYLYKVEILSYTSTWNNQTNPYPVHMSFRFQDHSQVYTETVQGTQSTNWDGQVVQELDYNVWLNKM